jgi:hypothetical protein
MITSGLSKGFLAKCLCYSCRMNHSAKCNERFVTISQANRSIKHCRRWHLIASCHHICNHQDSQISLVYPYAPFISKVFAPLLMLENGQSMWMVTLASQVILTVLTKPGLQQQRKTGIDSLVLFIMSSKLMTLFLVLLTLHCPESFKSVGLRSLPVVLLMFTHFRHLGMVTAWLGHLMDQCYLLLQVY